MFDGVSLKNCLPTNTIFIGKPINSNEHQYSIGRKEWQQNYTTENRMKYTEKDLRNNHANLDDKIYLIPNHSNFEIGMNNQHLLQTTNKNDYIPASMTNEEKEIFQQKFIPKNFHDELIDDNYQNRESIYKMSMINPKEQKINFDYDQVHFKTDKYVFDTITQEQKLKDKNCWSFDYYNQDKNNDHQRVPYQIRSINARLDIRRRHKGYIGNKQLWDPIANRFFQRPGENDKKIEGLRKEK